MGKNIITNQTPIPSDPVHYTEIANEDALSLSQDVQNCMSAGNLAEQINSGDSIRPISAETLDDSWSVSSLNAESRQYSQASECSSVGNNSVIDDINQLHQANDELGCRVQRLEDQCRKVDEQLQSLRKYHQLRLIISGLFCMVMVTFSALGLLHPFLVLGVIVSAFILSLIFSYKKDKQKGRYEVEKISRNREPNLLGAVVDEQTSSSCSQRGLSLP